eukprot:6838551-Lingulodinium_polyedra.AAC.1
MQSWPPAVRGWTLLVTFALSFMFCTRNTAPVCLATVDQLSRAQKAVLARVRMAVVRFIDSKEPFP